MLEITNHALGPAHEKPGFYIDGNTHGGEVAGSMIALFTAHYLLSSCGLDKEATASLDSRVWYILPRVNPDGAEAYLTSSHAGSGTRRPYPHAEQQDGLHHEDVNGDGMICQMRVEDPNGEWKVSSKDPRMMARRGPADSVGPFYHLYPEGYIKNFNGREVKMAPPLYGINLNRNYPSNWAMEYTQSGSGAYPTSEPEARAVIDFLLAHPNIAGAQSYHTHSGVILRPGCTVPDSQIPPKDMAAFKAIGEMGTKVTGYPVRSVYHGFTAEQSEPRHGVLIDWIHQMYGALGYTTEVWDIATVTGIDKDEYLKRMWERPEEFELKMLKWNDEHLGGEGFLRWTPFEHPQLGRVEIGGWKTKFVRQNPPVHMLEDECRKNCLFTVKHCLASPLVRIGDVAVEALAAGVYKVTVTAENRGFLPTNITEQALKVRAARPVELHAALPDGATFVTGEATTVLGHIEGLASYASGYFMGTPARTQVFIDFVVKARPGSAIAFRLSSQKGGTDRKTVVLP
ncbi:MAG: M14 family metallopeptidase [Bacillota bacterium]|nr:M14 family metallopeptidase [Bacillota bacterium]